MRKYRVAIITFVISILLCVSVGFLLKDKNRFVDDDNIHVLNSVDISYISVFENYRKLIDDMNDDAEIVRVKVTDKEVMNGTLLGTAQILDNYSNIYGLRGDINYIENVNVSYNGSDYSCYSDTTDAMTKVDNEYILALVPSKFCNKYYELAYPNASVLKISGYDSYNLNRISDDCTIVDDVDGQTQLYVMDEQMDFAFLDKIFNCDSKAVVEQCNNFIFDMYNKYQELLKRE